MGRFRSYFAVRPEGAGSRLALYACYLRASLARLAGRGPRPTEGRYLHRAITVRTEGMRLQIRPRTDDLSLALPGHRPSMDRWFRPRAGETVVDVGAHIGYYSVRAALVGARVLAFEPNPELRALAEQNLRLNGAGQVELRSTAAGPAYGRGTMWVSAPGPESRLPALPGALPADLEMAPAGLREIRVEVEPLDGVLSERREYGAIDWLRIDAEGSEPLVLEGASRTLERTAHVLVEVVRGPNAEECRTRLARAGLIVVARERPTPTTEWWWARRDPDSRVELRRIVPSGPAS